jgi:hypothetical protein
VEKKDIVFFDFYQYTYTIVPVYTKYIAIKDGGSRTSIVQHMNRTIIISAFRRLLRYNEILFTDSAIELRVFYSHLTTKEGKQIFLFSFVVTVLLVPKYRFPLISDRV